MAKGIQFELSIGGRQPRPITSRQLRIAGRILMIEFRKSLREVCDQIVYQLKTLYAKHERERTDGSEPLSERLSRALRYRIAYEHMGPIPDLVVGILDLDEAADATSDSQKGEPEGGWFILLEDGHEGMAHGSDIYGWLPIDMAQSLARRAADIMALPMEEASDLLQHVNSNMGGRHGDGIMVKLNRPIFFRYPEFGDALKWGVKPHMGFTAWNVYRTLAPAMAGEGRMGPGDRLVRDALDRGAARAAERIMYPNWA